MENAFSIKTSPAKIRIALRYSEFEVSKVDSAKFVAPSGVPVKAKATDFEYCLAAHRLSLSRRSRGRERESKSAYFCLHLKLREQSIIHLKAYSRHHQFGAGESESQNLKGG